MPLGMEIGLSPRDFVLDGDPAPLPKKEAEPGGGAPQFLAHVCCGQTAAIAVCIKMELGMDVSLGPVRIGVDGDTAPLPQKRGRALPPTEFSAHLYCGQTAGCIKMPLGMDIGLSPGDIVLDGGPVRPHQKGGGAPKFSAHVYCGQTVRCIKMPLGTKVDLSPVDSVLDGDPATHPHQKEVEPAPQFSAHFYCSQTAGCIKMPLGMQLASAQGTLC